MKLDRAFLIAAMFAYGVVASPISVEAIEGTGASEGASAGLEQLRKEIETLRHRIEQLESAPGARAVGDAGEKARLIAETAQILAQYRAGKAAAWKETHTRIRDLRQQVASALEEMQRDYTRRARLDEAVAIRNAIRCLADGGRKVLADPGRLSFSGAKSEVLFFRVTGANSGSLYGTGVYTSDSSLATAAVHAGVLKLGQTGIIKVTTIPSHPQYPGSTQHGITSSSWGSYPGFRVQPLDDEDLDLADSEAVGGGVSNDEAPAKPAPACALPKPVSTDAVVLNPSEPGRVAWPVGLPPEAREHLEGHLTVVAELRQATREKVAHLAADSINRLGPIQDAHTRAARLDEAIAVRELIRELTP